MTTTSRPRRFTHRTFTILTSSSPLLLLLLIIPTRALSQIPVDLSAYQNSSGITITTNIPDAIRISWQTDNAVSGEMILDLRAGQPLIQTLGVSKNGGAVCPIATSLNPVTTLTIGQRDAKKAAEGFRQMVFFEKLWQQPHQSFNVMLTPRSVRVSSEGSRTTVSISGIEAGSFAGELQFMFYRNSPLIRADTVLRTHENLRAILYDSGLSSTAPDWNKMVWADALGTIRSAEVTSNSPAAAVAVKYRTMIAEGRNGSIAVFPAPHQYFYPLDFADNFKFTWFGRGYRELPEGFSFGIRQPLDGDQRWVPWFDAPAESTHRLGVFYLISPAEIGRAHV